MRKIPGDNKWRTCHGGNAMKAFVLLFAVTVMSSVVAVGFGEFIFTNRQLPENDARFVLCTDAPGTSSVSGSGFHVQLSGGPIGTPVDEFKRLAMTDFRVGI